MLVKDSTRVLPLLFYVFQLVQLELLMLTVYVYANQILLNYIKLNPHLFHVSLHAQLILLFLEQLVFAIKDTLQQQPELLILLFALALPLDIF